MIEEQVVNLIVDHREAKSGLIDELVDYVHETKKRRVTTHVEVATLPVGDIICSDRVCIERKSSADFANTITNHERDLWRQIADTAKAYRKPLVILEGESMFGIRGVEQESIRGALAGVAIGFNIPTITTANVAETAAMVVTIARREQFKHRRGISMHGKRSTMTLPQRQIYVVSAIGDGVGPVVAKDLLKHFKSVRAVMNASIDELIAVKGVGQKIAEKLHDIVRGEHK